MLPVFRVKLAANCAPKLVPTTHLQDSRLGSFGHARQINAYIRRIIVRLTEGNPQILVVKCLLPAMHMKMPSNHLYLIGATDPMERWDIR